METHLNQSKLRYFILWTALLCLAYLSFELFYTNYAILSVDEFWFAHRTYQYKSGLPYRDFAPYKTVLGYYLLLIPMTLVQGLLKPLFFTKNALALLNSTILFGTTLWLRRYFSDRALITTLMLLVCAEFILSYSTNIRVDLLAYWFCLFSVLFLFENKFILSGLLIGLGFLTSQKAIWYIAATDIALAVHWLAFARDWKTIKQILIFNLTILLIISAYILFWSHFSNFSTVMHSVFTEASIMYHLDWYNGTRKLFWFYILSYNPLLFILWPLTLISAVITYPSDHSYTKRVFLVTYVSVILLCLIPYKQVFPYYMLVTIPAFLLLYSAFFTWFYQVMRNPQPIRILLVGKIGLTIFATIYCLTIIWLIFFLKLPKLYLLLTIIPIMLVGSINGAMRAFAQPLILMTIVFTGFVYPLTLYAIRFPALNSGYQHSVMNLLNALLQDNSDYLAGIELIYNKTQPIAGMRHLMLPAIDFLAHPSPKLREAMLASLYESPTATSASVIHDLEKSNVKLYVNNYRMVAVPTVIANYLASQYQHFWGGIYLYAPEIPAGTHAALIKFAGNYLVEAWPGQSVSIDKHVIDSGKTLSLTKGIHTIHASTSIRLKLLPENVSGLLNPAYKEDQWQLMLF